jgi:hypothetical protein
LTGLNKAFVIDGATRNRLIQDDPKSAEIIKPILRGRDIRRWRIEFADQWLIRIESSENRVHPWSELSGDAAETSFSATYPAIHMLLARRRKELVNRHDKGRFFWELRSCKYWEEFEGPKIIYPNIATEPRFVFDTMGYLIGDTGFGIPANDPWILGVLNSPVSAWYYGETSAQIQGGYYRFFTQYISQVRIPDATTAQQAAIRALVIILSGDFEISPRWHQLLNGLVYELFFAEELHAKGIRLFEEFEKLGLHCTADSSKEQAETLVVSALTLTGAIFRNEDSIYRMLFDLQAIPAVRIIEGKD